MIKRFTARGQNLLQNMVYKTSQEPQEDIYQDVLMRLKGNFNLLEFAAPANLSTRVDPTFVA